MTSIRILLVDDHPMLRLGVRRSLENEESFAVAGECADLASVRAWLSSGGKADVAILDRGLPDGDGLEVVPPLKAAGMKVIVLTVEDDDEEILAAALQTAAQGDLTRPVIISADAMAAHQSVINVMDAARRVGLVQLTFATQSSRAGGSVR